jgi:hypothetical protein
MVLPKLLYYELSDVAKRWRMSEGELLQWAATGAMRLAFYCLEFRCVDVLKSAYGVPKYETFISDDYLYAIPNDISRILAGHSVECNHAVPTSTASQKFRLVLWQFIFLLNRLY